MRFFTALFNRVSWPGMTADTTTPSYWFNWRFLLCALWVLVAMVYASLLIWKYEGRRLSRDRSSDDEQEIEGFMYEDDVWKTCSKSVHPFWLFAYRIIAFSASLALLLADVIIHGAVEFFFYTEWTFTLVTLYFGLGTVLSTLGCLSYFREGKQKKDFSTCTNTDHGSYVPPLLTQNTGMACQNEGLSRCAEPNCKSAASVYGYALQIIFQMCAGSVALTDSVFWLIIYPYITAKDYRLKFLIISKHSVNAVFLLGDAILNRMRFPFFRIAYFVLWTCMYVVFQWIVHACVSIRWPYPFLDLSSSYSPLWYLAVGLLLIPCFGIFTLVFRLKQCCISR